ncbi:hypothetical protein DSECCO2_397710 [anaerobic digester metagenome]
MYKIFYSRQGVDHHYGEVMVIVPRDADALPCQGHSVDGQETGLKNLMDSKSQHYPCHGGTLVYSLRYMGFQIF